jgi:hypothetical protein
VKSQGGRALKEAYKSGRGDIVALLRENGAHLDTEDTEKDSDAEQNAKEDSSADSDVDSDVYPDLGGIYPPLEEDSDEEVDLEDDSEEADSSDVE